MSGRRAQRPVRRPPSVRPYAVVLVLAMVIGITATGDSPRVVPGAAPTPSPIVEVSPNTGGAATPSTSAPRSVRVSSIAALKRALADDTVDEIVVADGTYRVSPSHEERTDSLWIGAEFADRRRPVVVRAATTGGVTFDGDGRSGFGGLSFEDGVHDQTWDGFTFANMRADQSGIVEVGGYLPRRPPHNLTLRNLTITASCTGSATSALAPTVDHAVYIANAAREGPHDILIEDLTVDGGGHLASAVHFDHGDETDPPASKVTVRRLRVVGTQQAIILWEPPLHDITFDGATIRDALRYAVRYESSGGSGIVFANMTSTGSGVQGFFSSQGPAPVGVTLTNTDLR